MAATATIARPSKARKFVSLLRSGDQVTHLVTLIFGLSVVLVTIYLVYELWIHSGPTRNQFGLGFLAGRTWDPIA